MMENKYYTPTIEVWKDVVDYEDEYMVLNKEDYGVTYR